MSAPDGDDYTWEEGSGQLSVGQAQGPARTGMGERHVAAMERVVGLWPYPTMVAVGVLAEVLGFVRAAARPVSGVTYQVSGVTYQVSGTEGGGWDWRKEFAPLEPDGCYECDQ